MSGGGTVPGGFFFFFPGGPGRPRSSSGYPGVSLGAGRSEASQL